MPYVAQLDGHDYILVPVVEVELSGNDVQQGAYVYSRAGKYLGFWPCQYMPNQVYYPMMQYIKRHVAADLPERPPIESVKELWLR